MKRFKKIYIEITNICNLSCSFCHKSQRSPQILSYESFKYILNQIKPYTDYIYLHVKGEPLLHPQLPDLLDLANNLEFKVNITTNGVLIDRIKEFLLNEPAIRQINFSLHSFTENKKANYIEDILQFAHEALDKTAIIISLRLWNLDKNNNESSLTNKLIIKTIEEHFPSEMNVIENLVPGKGLKLRERLYLNTDFEFEWPNLTSHYHNENGFCYALRDQVAIIADGTVVPCCLDGEGITNLGNVFEQNFEEIIENDRAKAIYNGFTNHRAVEELCFKCSYKEKFW